jgi:CRP/FNR family transcriptional regulator, cyclic AMP receptor protein
LNNGTTELHCAVTLACGSGEWIEATGYLASLLVFATFCMKTMIPLRIAAISSNIAFIVYSSFDGMYPILILHSVLLPLNAFRMLQTCRRHSLARRATRGRFRIDWLGPFVKTARQKAGGVIFSLGDKADRVYLLVAGNVVLEESGHVLQAGDLFGIVGMFSVACERTQTARAITDAELLWLTASEFTAVCCQNPEMVKSS